MFNSVQQTSQPQSVDNDEIAQEIERIKSAHQLEILEIRQSYEDQIDKLEEEVGTRVEKEKLIKVDKNNSLGNAASKQRERSIG